MRKVAAALVCALALALGACATAREKAFHDAVEQLTVKSGMLSQYQKYVDDDPKLKAESKKIRRETADRLRAVLDEERRALK